MFTPWGNADYKRTLTRGVHVVSTPSHGGVMIAKGYAKKNLSETAIKCGLEYGNYLCYEEDCDYCIPAYELPELFPDLDVEAIFKSLSRWRADYLLDRGIQPDEEGYAEYLRW